MCRSTQALVVFLSLVGASRAQERAEAAITGITSAPLFTISWNLTNNYVEYDAKLKDGKFDPKEPVTAYWIMNQTDGHRESLTLIERLKGYGFTIHPGRAPDAFDMVVVSVKKKTLHISREGGQFNVTLHIGDCEMARLTQAHVQAHWWHLFPIGEYVDLTGTDVNTGAECRERVMHE
jgi:hypothetical protein